MADTLLEHRFTWCSLIFMGVAPFSQWRTGDCCIVERRARHQKPQIAHSWRARRSWELRLESRCPLTMGSGYNIEIATPVTTRPGDGKAAKSGLESQCAGRAVGQRGAGRNGGCRPVGLPPRETGAVAKSAASL